jgi:hypothetical protein
MLFQVAIFGLRYNVTLFIEAPIMNSQEANPSLPSTALSAITSSPKLNFEETLVASAWGWICDRFAAFILQHQEPIVTEGTDQQGDYWHLYDPNTQAAMKVRSQQEALLWLEQCSRQMPPISHDYFARRSF